MNSINEFVRNVRENIDMYLAFFEDITQYKMTKERLGTFLGFSLGTGSDLLESEVFTKTRDKDLVYSMQSLVHYYAGVMREEIPKIQEYMKKNKGRLSKSDAVYYGMMGIQSNGQTPKFDWYSKFTPDIIPDILKSMETSLSKKNGS